MPNQISKLKDVYCLNLFKGRRCGRYLGKEDILDGQVDFYCTQCKCFTSIISTPLGNGDYRKIGQVVLKAIKHQANHLTQGSL